MAATKGKGFLADEDGEMIEVDGVNHHVLFQVQSVNRDTGDVTMRFVEHGEAELPDVGDLLQVVWFEVPE